MTERTYRTIKSKGVVKMREVFVIQPPDPAKLTQLTPAARQAISEFIIPGKIRSLLPTEELIPTAQAFIDGQIINWDDDNVSLKITRQLAGGLLSRMVGRIGFDYQPNEKTDQVFDTLRNDLYRFTPDKTLLTSTSLPEWYCKFRVGMALRMTIEMLNSFNGINDLASNPKAKKYLDELEKQGNILSETVQDLGEEDLDAYIHLGDLWAQPSDDEPGSKPFFPLKKSMLDLADESVSILKKLTVVYDEAWDRLRKDWKWPQIKQALNLLPTIRSTGALTHVVSALESNLIQSPGEKPFQTDDLDINGLITLLKFDWSLALERYPGIPEQYPRLPEHLKQRLEIPPDFSIPRKYLPSAIIELLTRALEPIGLLKKVQGALPAEATTSWLLALIALKKTQPDLKDNINSLIETLNYPPAIHSVALDEQPGRLWLTTDGKIHPRQRDEILSRGFLIHISTAKTAVAIEKSQPVIKIKQPDIEEPIPTIPSQKDFLPFLGEIRLIRNYCAAEFTTSLFSKANIPLNLDDEYERFERLSETLKLFPLKRTFLYLEQFNPKDPYMKNAYKLGFEAVYLDPKQIRFILKGDSPNLSLGGSLDTEGQLRLLDTPDSFIGEPEQLFLNNLGLHLATQPLYKDGVISNYDKTVATGANILAASWNRAVNRRLPKIGLTKTNPFIVAQIDRTSEPILLGQIS